MVDPEVFFAPHTTITITITTAAAAADVVDRLDDIRRPVVALPRVLVLPGLVEHQPRAEVPLEVGDARQEALVGAHAPVQALPELL